MIASATVLSHKPAANATLIHSISWAWGDFLHFIVMVVASYLCHKENNSFNSAACGTRATSHCPCLNSCTGASLWFLTFHSHLHHLPQISILLSHVCQVLSATACHFHPTHFLWIWFFFFFFTPVSALSLATCFKPGLPYIIHFCVRSWKCNNEGKQKWSTNTRGFELPAEKPQTRRLVLSLEREKK